VQSVSGIVPAIAQAMGFSFHGEGPQEAQLVAYLRDKQVLLVLDNCEHLVEGAGLGARILEAAPQVKICATSRAPLNVSGEQLYPVPGMDVPSLETGATLALQDVARYSALKLFVAGAQRVRPDFALSENNLADVVRVCRLMEGMPLGILLAAAWVSALSPTEIAAEVGRSLDFLETDWRDVPARQRSMRAVFDHSWALLSERERAILAGLSVFSGGFTREAAQRVAGASLREVMGLVNRSLVHRTAGARYELHELLRQYAAEKLAAVPEMQIEVRDRHCATYAAALEQWDAELKGPRQLDAVSEIEADLGNARAAWEWAVERADVAHLGQAMDGLCRFYEWRGRYEEGETACHAAADRLAVPEGMAEGAIASDAARVWTKATAWRGAFCRDLRRLEKGKCFLGESLACLDTLAYAELDVRLERAFALWHLGYTLYHLGDKDTARQRYEESLALYEVAGRPWERGFVLYHLGDLLQMMGRPAEAEVVAREGLAILRQLGDRRETAAALRVSGFIASCAGRWEEGERLTRESVASFRAVGDRAHAAEALITLGQSLTFLGRLVEAHAQLEESVAVYEDLEFSGVSSCSALTNLGEVDLGLGRYDQAHAVAQRALALAQKSGHRLQTGRALLVLCLAAIAKGEYGKVSLIN
jgi:predicted ATPase